MNTEHSMPVHCYFFITRLSWILGNIFHHSFTASQKKNVILEKQNKTGPAVPAEYYVFWNNLFPELVESHESMTSKCQTAVLQVVVTAHLPTSGR